VRNAVLWKLRKAAIDEFEAAFPPAVKRAAVVNTYRIPTEEEQRAAARGSSEADEMFLHTYADPVLALLSAKLESSESKTSDNSAPPHLLGSGESWADLTLAAVTAVCAACHYKPSENALLQRLRTKFPRLLTHANHFLTKYLHAALPTPPAPLESVNGHATAADAAAAASKDAAANEALTTRYALRIAAEEAAASGASVAVRSAAAKREERASNRQFVLLSLFAVVAAAVYMRARAARS
jgi:hypothetical protein